MPQDGSPPKLRDFPLRMFAVAFAVSALAAAAGVALSWQLHVRVADLRASEFLLFGVAVSSGLFGLGLIGIGYSALRARRQWHRERADADAALRQAHEEREHRRRLGSHHDDPEGLPRSQD